MRSRLLPLALALCAAIAFAFAMQMAWWTASEVAIGPFGSRACFGGECSNRGLAWIGGSDLWMRASIASRAGGYISAFLLVVVAGALAARRVPKLMARAALVSIATSVVVGAYFQLKFPGVATATVSIGAWLFGIAVVLGIVASVLTLRLPARP